MQKLSQFKCSSGDGCKIMMLKRPSSRLHYFNKLCNQKDTCWWALHLNLKRPNASLENQQSPLRFAARIYGYKQKNKCFLFWWGLYSGEAWPHTPLETRAFLHLFNKSVTIYPRSAPWEGYRLKCLLTTICFTHTSSKFLVFCLFTNPTSHFFLSLHPCFLLGPPCTL